MSLLLSLIMLGPCFLMCLLQFALFFRPCLAFCLKRLRFFGRGPFRDGRGLGLRILQFLVALLQLSEEILNRSLQLLSAEVR